MRRYWDGTRWTSSRVAKGEAIPLAGSPEERRIELDKYLQEKTAEGYRLESQTDFQAIIVTGKRPNHVLHLLLTVFTVGIWLPVWLYLIAFSRERREVVSVDEYGAVDARRP